MPFAAVQRPSIGLGLLQAALRAAGIDVSVWYPNLTFAERVGLDVYAAVASTRNDDLLGEWVFSRVAFPEFEGDDERYLGLVDLAPATLRLGSREAVLAVFQRMRDAAEAFIDDLARAIVTLRPRVVGVSTMFQQHCASLALLRRLRELAPAITTLMGGANCESMMGRATFEAFPWVDYVVAGEADDVIVPLVADILACGREVPAARLAAGVYGPVHRAHPPSDRLARPQVRTLDRLPTPTYHDYFATLEGSPLRARIRPGLLVETSRGCWWGARHHCAFCGLNGVSMTFREKSPARVVAELAELSSAYGLRTFEITDNILSMKYFGSVLPTLAEAESGYTIFAETKANLKREHVQRLVAAGIRWIQPGIESMHDDLLRHIDKGTTVLINIQLLKWTREMGVTVSWNMLYGFPGEEAQQYEEMAALLPLLFHLQPPQAMLPMRYDRFSPYQTRPADFGIEIAPNRSYRYIYPLAPALLDDLAYFFQGVSQAGEVAPPDWPPSRKGPAHAAVDVLVTDWLQRFWSKLPPLLSMTDDGDRLIIVDTRPCATERRVTLTGRAREVYLACDVPRRAAHLPDADALLDDFGARGLMVCIDGQYLSLAVRGSLPPLMRPWEFPGGVAGSLTDIGAHHLDAPATPRGRPEKASPSASSERSP